jgi:hypothetical protein
MKTPEAENAWNALAWYAYQQASTRHFFSRRYQEMSA